MSARVEAWAVVREDGAVEEAWADKEEAERHARAMTTSTPRNYNVRRLVSFSIEEVQVVKAARTMMAALPEGWLDAARADTIFWERFDALGRALQRLKESQ